MIRLKVNKHNLRDYDNQRELITTIYGTNDIVEDVKQVSLDEFKQARIEYNARLRADRKVTYYFQKVCNSQNDIACEIIIELGDMDFWKEKDNEYRKYKNITKHILMIVARISELSKEKQNQIGLYLFDLINIQ